MGIKNFNPFLKKNHPEVFKKQPITNLSGKRIAIDAHQWMYRYISVAHKKTVDSTDIAISEPDRNKTITTWITFALEFICTLLTYNITPVFVFDGEAPVDKTETKKERMEQKKKINEETSKLKTELFALDILDRNVNLVEQLRKLIKQQTYISGHEMDTLKNVLTGIGIPCIQAKQEGEQLCSFLAIEGKVDAVFTTDTDTIIYGAPMVITDFAELLDISETADSKYAGKTIHQVSTIELKDVLTALNITYSTLVDLGIMAGCDYNSNIKNLGIGKAYKLLKEFKTIDKLPEGKYDLTILKYLRCRELFRYQLSNTLIGNEETKDILNINSERFSMTGRDSLSIVNEMLSMKYMHRLTNLYSNMTSPVENTVSKPAIRVKLNIIKS